MTRIQTTYCKTEEREAFSRAAEEAAANRKPAAQGTDLPTEPLVVVRLTELMKRLSEEALGDWSPGPRPQEGGIRCRPDRSLVRADRLADSMQTVLEKYRFILLPEIYEEMEAWVSFIRGLSSLNILVDMDC